MGKPVDPTLLTLASLPALGAHEGKGEAKIQSGRWPSPRVSQPIPWPSGCRSQVGRQQA